MFTSVYVGWVGGQSNVYVNIFWRSKISIWLWAFEGHEKNCKYRKSSKETHGSYSFSEGPNAGLLRIWPKFGHFYLLFFNFAAGLIRMRVLFEGRSLSRIYSIWNATINFDKKNRFWTSQDLIWFFSWYIQESYFRTFNYKIQRLDRIPETKPNFISSTH